METRFMPWYKKFQPFLRSKLKQVKWRTINLFNYQILTCKKLKDWGWVFFRWEGRGRSQPSNFEQGWGGRCLQGKQVRSKMKQWKRQDATKL